MEIYVKGSQKRLGKTPYLNHTLAIFLYQKAAEGSTGTLFGRPGNYIMVFTVVVIY